MWLHRLTHYLLSHRWQAWLLVFASTFVPVVGVLGILYAALVTLQKNPSEGAYFTLAATLPYVISFYFTGSHEPAIPLMLWAAVGVAILSNLLTWVFAVMLKRQMSWGGILQIAALLGVLVISLIHQIFPDVANWWSSQLSSYYAKASAAVNGMLKAGPLSPTDTQLESINLTKYYATGIMVAAVLFNAVMQLIIARWWQYTVFQPGALRKELHGIRLSPLAGGLFALGLVLSYLGNSVVLDIMPILYVLFAAAGLSLVHYLFGLMQSPTRWFWLSLVYVALIFAMPASLVFIGMLALLDIWLDVRKRLRKI